MDKSFNYTLYIDNKPLVYSSFTDRSVFKVYKENKHLLPPAIRSNPTYDSLDIWLSQRAIPIDRANAKRVLNALNLPQLNKTAIIIACRGVSLIDSYWIKMDRDVKWEEVNFRKNSFNKTIAIISLKGSAHPDKFTLEGDLSTPELTNQGTYAKCWRREDNGLYLYKSRTRGKYEPEAEVVTSKVADILGISHVEYKLATLEGVRCCKCKNIANERLAIVPADDYLKYIGNPRYDTLQGWLMMFKGEKEREKFLQMMLLDGLVCNTDRHLLNWGFIMDNRTGEILGQHPLFDHNCAVDINDNPREIPSHFNRRISLVEAGKYAYKNLPKMEPQLIELSNWYRSAKVRQYFKELYGRLDELEYLCRLLYDITGIYVKPKSFFTSLFRR